MIQISRKYVLLWGILAALFLLEGFGYYFILVPQRKEAKNLERKLSEIREKRVVENKRGIQSQIYAIRAERQIQEFDKSLPNRREFADILKDIFSLIDGENLILRQVRYSPKNIGNSDVWDYSADLTIVGDYGMIKEFLNGLEWSNHLLVLRSFRLTGMSEKRTVALNVTLSTFLSS